MKKVIFSIWALFYLVLLPFSPQTMVALAETKIGADDVESVQMLHLREDAKNLLEKNTFVVVPTRAYKDMNDAYEAFRKDNLPIFLTSDSVFHTTHLLFDYLLRTIK